MIEEITCPFCYGRSSDSLHTENSCICWFCCGLGLIPYEKWEKYLRGEI